VNGTGRYIDSGALVVPGIEDVVVAMFQRRTNFPGRMAASSLCNPLLMNIFSL
jgi:hypothetical protein